MNKVLTTILSLVMILSSLLAARLSEGATTECIKTFVVTGKGAPKEVQLRKAFADISPATKQQSRDMEFDIYDTKNPNHNYSRTGDPTRYQNCAGLVMERVLKTGQHAYNVDAFKKDVLEPYSIKHFTISKTLAELNDVEEGDILYYGNGLHVAYVKKVETRPGLKGKVITIESKADQESIWEATLEPTEYHWHKDRDPLVRTYGLPEVYRLDKAISAQPKYQGDCDLEDLTIEVKEGNNYLVGATVETTVGGQVSKGVTAGSQGRATIKKAKGKEAVVTVSMTDYFTKTETVPEAYTAWTIYLDKKPKVDDIKNMLEGKIQRLIQLRDAAKTAQDTAKASLGGSRAQALQEAGELVKALETQKKTVEQANTDCLQIPTLTAQIATDVAKAQSTRNVVQTEMQTIASRVASCSTKADVDFLDQAWDKASKNAGTALAYGARAEGTVQKILNIITRANAVRSSLNVSKGPPDPSIKYLMERLDLIRLPDQTYYKTLDSHISDANTKAKTFRDAKDNLIWEIHGYRGKMGTANEAIFDALSARVRAITLAEEDLKAQKEGLLQQLRAIYDAKKNAKTLYSQLLALPLCAGANTGVLSNYLNEAKKAQSDVVQAMGGDLLSKINACRARLNLPLPPGPPQPPGTGPVKSLRGFSIYPRTVYLTPGQRQEFEALVAYADGTREDISRRDIVTWEPSRIFSSTKEGTFYVKVTARLNQVRMDTATIHVMIPKENVLLTGPDKGKAGTQATFDVTGLGNAPGGAPQGYHFQWLGDGKTLGSKTTRQVIKLNTPGSHTVSVKIWRWTDNKWQFFVERSKTLVITRDGDVLGMYNLDGFSGPTRELSYNASAGKNALSGSYPIRGFGDSTKVDVWVPFAFQFSPLPRAVGAKIVMVVKPIEQLIGTDQLVLKGKGKDHVVYSGFSSLKAKSWNTVEVPISGNAELMDAIRTTGRIEGVIQDDTAVQSVKLVITVPQ